MDLVIGGTGFLGGEIIRQLLEQGKTVRAFCRRSGDIPGGAEIVSGNVRDLESLKKAMQGVETVYHTASWPNISVHWKPFYETNVLGTQNVIDASRLCGVRKLIYTSSASVCFDCSSQEGIDEAAPYPDRWLAHYPHSKAIAEKMVLDAATTKSRMRSDTLTPAMSRMRSEAELPGGELLTCSIRPHLIIGGRDKHLLPRLFDRARRGRLFRVGDGTNLIDIIFVENAALGHIQAADALTDASSPVNGNAYFLSQGEPVNCWDWISEVLRMKGLPAVRRAVSYQAAWRYGILLEGWHKLWGLQGEPLMTRFLAAQLAQTHYLNISRAKKDFGYEPIVKMEEGMKILSKNF